MSGLEIEYNRELESIIGRPMYTFTHRDAANEEVYIPDLHLDMDSYLEAADRVREESRGRAVIVTASDLSEFKNRIHGQNVYEQLGIIDNNTLEFNLIASQLDSDGERDKFIKIFSVRSNGGIDNYAQLMAQQYGFTDTDSIRKEFEELEQDYKTSGLEDKVEEIKSSNVTDLTKYREFNEKKNRLLEDVILEYEARVIGEGIVRANEGDKETYNILGGGNHDTTTLINKIKKYVFEKTGRDDLVHDINNIAGAIQLGGNGNEEYLTQLSGNIYGISQHAHVIIGFTEEDYRYEMPHMIEDMERGMVAQDFDHKNLDKINPEAVKQSIEVMRLTNGGKETRKLHRFKTHMEFQGNRGAMGYRDKPDVYPKLDNVAVWHFAENNVVRDEEGFTYQEVGHLHLVAAERDEETKQDKSRAHVSIVGIKNREVLDLQPTEHEYNVEEIKQEAGIGLTELEQEFLKSLEAANDEFGEEDNRTAA